MNDSKISVRYARALFGSAKEKNVLDQVRSDMNQVLTICDVSEFQYLLITPLIKESQKRDILNQLLKGKVQEISLALLELVFKNGREQFIPAIARNFQELYKEHKGIQSAVLTSAFSLSQGMQEEIRDIIHTSLNAPIELEVKEDDDLIGGFVIRIEDKQYDASVANSLKKVKKQLLN